jgi:hypothetical protein
LVGSAVVRVCGRIVDAASEAAATKAFVGAVAERVCGAFSRVAASEVAAAKALVGAAATRVCGAYSRVAASGEAVTKAIAGAMAA